MNNAELCVVVMISVASLVRVGKETESSSTWNNFRKTVQQQRKIKTLGKWLNTLVRLSSLLTRFTSNDPPPASHSSVYNINRQKIPTALRRFDVKFGE